MSAAQGSCEHWAAAKPADIAIVAGDIVVARTHIRIEWAILAAAVAKLGCSLLGLNWRLTPVEVRYVLTNSQAHALICDDADPVQLAPRLTPS